MDNRTRILKLLDYLQRYTDEEHRATSGELIALLSEEEKKIDRKTLRKDALMLQAAGCDVEIEEGEGRSTRYFVAARPFELAELKLLIDAVSASQFISERKSRQLIGKLMGLVSTHQAQGLTRHLYVPGKKNAPGAKFFYAVDAVNDAINERKKIRFQYYDFVDGDRKVLRNKGEYYVCSPYSLVWRDDRYYMVGWSDKRETVVSFRVDRICKPELMEEAAVPAPKDFAIADFVDHRIRMYGKDEEIVRVSLRCANDVRRVVTDYFGEQMQIIREEKESFDVEVDIALNALFYAWVFEREGAVSILSPERAREGYIRLLEASLAAVRGEG